jgi:parvulin-like peptidyl-prolyl isomerase
MKRYTGSKNNLVIIVFSLLFVSLLPGWVSDKVDDQVVAKFGNNQITLGEFKIAYMQLIKQPKVFDSKALRKNFLDELIKGRLLSQEAKRESLDTSELIKYRIDAFRNKCLRNGHFEKVIKPMIHVDEKDVEEAYLFTREERRISHLFSLTKAGADSLYQLLNNGASFDSLASVTFKDTVLANHGGDLGWINWDQLEYDMGMTVFRMNVNEISEPIKSIFGYHIIKVTGIKKKPLISGNEYELQRKKAKYLLETKIGEKLAFEYIDKMRESAKILIYPDIVKLAILKLSGIFTRKPSHADQMYEIQLKDEEIKSVETSLWNEHNKVIAIINDKNLTVGEFIGYLSFVPYEVIYNGIKPAMDYIFRDYLVTEEAKQMGLEQDKNVLQKTKVYTDNLLQFEMRKKLVQGVEVKDNEVKQYYEKHKSKYKGATYEQMHDNLYKLVTDEKKRNVVSEYVNKLSKNMKITKNVNLIQKYFDAILNNRNPGQNSSGMSKTE